jgi:hypothetical protein
MQQIADWLKTLGMSEYLMLSAGSALPPFPFAVLQPTSE